MAKQLASDLWAATGNRLADGSVVFLSEHGIWQTDLQAAAIARDAIARETLQAHSEAGARSAQIVGPYLVAVSEVDGRYEPTSLRERIRADGLTFRTIAAEAVVWL